jgi:uncharacterized membrane protein
MSDLYLAVKLLHILGATVLLGTGLGIAFFMFMAHRTGHPATIAHTARVVVIADALFTAGAVVLQPLTGWAMAAMTGYSTFHFWIRATLALYVVVGLCWLPVVWIQFQLRDLAAAAARDGRALPERYYCLFRVWFWLGWPAFLGVIAIFALMIFKPQW